MNKIKTEEDFRKTIQFEWLAKTDDSQKYMLKSYLNILLEGGRLKKTCSMYVVGKIDRSATNPAFFSEPDQPLKDEMDMIPDVKYGISSMINQFIELLRKRQWTTETAHIEEFDENDNKIDYSMMDETKKVIVSRRVTTIVKTEYFIDASLDIEEVKLR